MKLQDLLIELKNNKVILYLEKDKLKIKIPKNISIDHLFEEIKRQKEEIIEVLKNFKYQKQDYIKNLEEKEYYQLSSAQKRLYILQQMDVNSTAYNMPDIMPLEKREKERIEIIFKQLISRHDSFRTSFKLLQQDPVQYIEKNVDFAIEEITVEKEKLQDIRKGFMKAFDLSKAPLLRVILINIKEGGCFLFIDMHHIISDGVSSKILEKEFQYLYKGIYIPKLRLQYKDYSKWQKSEEFQIKIKKQEEYWLNRFYGEIPVLNLSCDYARPAIQSFEGASVSFLLNKQETLILKKLSSECGLTLYMVLVGVFNILLHKLSGQEDILIGTPIAGRTHSDFEGIVGMFVNSLVLWNKVEGNTNLIDFFGQVRKNTLEAYDNQDYQFEDLVEKLKINRDASRNPLFSVMFNLLNHDEYSNNVSEFDGQELIHIPGISKFDLNFTATDYNDQILLKLEYSSKLFKRETINRFVDFIKYIIFQIPDKLNENISSINLLNDNYKPQLLIDFNNTSVLYEKNKSIIDLFKEQCEKYPDKIALADISKKLTYKDLDIASNKIANIINKHKASSNEMIGLLTGRSVEMIISILGILKTGAAYVPLDPTYPVGRVNHMIEDCGMEIIICTEKEIKEYEFSGNVIFTWSDEVQNSGTEFFSNEISSQQLAYVMYTSGSTGKPKGVEIEHKSVVRLVNNNKFFPFSPDHNILLTGAPVFDATTFEIWGAILNGGSLFVTDNESIIKAGRLKECIDHNKITTLWLTSSLLNQLVDQDESLFGSLKYLLAGGDVLSLKHINKIRKKCPELTIINGYGPTENTTFSTTFKIDRDYESNIPIGKPISNSTAYIVDNKNQLQAIGVPGELLVGGDGLARGYLNNSTLTQERFIQSPFNQGERLYRTGDLARWLPDGNIEFLGRVDNQVKIRGYRVELGEIENILNKHESIKDSIILIKEINGEKVLIAYIILLKELDTHSIRNYLLGHLPEYMVPVYYMNIDEFPLNINGKVDRKKLPEPNQIKETERYIAPSNDIEKKVAAIWSEILNIPENEISVITNFFTIGGHSLKAAILTGKIFKLTNVELMLNEIFLYTTIRAQAEQISVRKKKEYQSIPKATEKEYYKLSSAQKRIYFLQQMDLSSTTYNMPYIIPLDPLVETNKIKDIFSQLIQRHESFRTYFNLINDEPIQKIKDSVEIDIEENKINHSELELEYNDFIKPFNLANAPLIRATILKTEKGDVYLLLDMHHIISDGVSQGILEREFKTLYNNQSLPERLLQYKDYSEWQNNTENKNLIHKQKEYWLSIFKEEIAYVNLPIDFVRPTVQSFKGASASFILNKQITNTLKEFCKEQGLTLYMALLFAFDVLLSKLSGQENIVVGTPVAGRTHTDLEDVVGMFVNTLAIKNQIVHQGKVRALIESIKRNTIEAFENQEYQFEDLVEEISVERDISRNPIFDVMFNLLNQQEVREGLSEINENTIIHESGLSKFDMSLTATDYGQQISLSLTYCTDLFKESNINKYISYLKYIISQLPTSLDKNVSEIDILTQDEKEELLFGFNQTTKKYPEGHTIIDLFEKQIHETPDRVALVYGNESLTYSELNIRSNEMANLLHEKGVCKNEIIAIIRDRSVEMLVSIFGILKSGCIYLPVDPDYPSDRIEYILKDSKAKYIISNRTERLSEKYEGEVIDIKSINNINAYKEQERNPEKATLAYIIYTSGSTGNPKGVLIENEKAVNLLYYLQDNYPVKEKDSYLLKTSYCFDVSVSEIFGWILGGGKLNILEQGHEKNPIEIIKSIDKYHVTHINFVPTVFKLFSDSLLSFKQKNLRTLKYVMLAGEALLKYHLKDFFTFNPKIQVGNLYGPTESTVYSSNFPLSKDDNKILIGKPISNYHFYIFDQYRNLQPVGIAGELYIGGKGLALGYLNNPILTSGSFIENPYISGERLYRTGDLVRWMHDGNVEFLGRIDHQVKIRGYRIELGEIENTLLKISYIQKAVVIPRGESGEKYLCSYIVVDDEINIDEIKALLAESLPDYMIPSYFIQLESFPITTNGKLNRKALPDPEIKVGNDYESPSNGLERELVKIWSEVLNINQELISINTNFFNIGGHSLRAFVLAGKIYKEMDVEMPLKDIFLNPTVRLQALYLSNKEKKLYAPIPKAKQKKYYKASSAQERLYLLQQMELESTAYNMPYIIELEAGIDEGRIKTVLNELIYRHESFRTSFELIDEIPVQIVHDRVDFEFERYVIENDEEIYSTCVFPFKLAEAPLIRASIIDLKESKKLFVDMHHIISDGLSQVILEREFGILYRGGKMEPLNIQYKDYSEWQNSDNYIEEKNVQKEFWINEYKDEIPVLNLSTDFIRPKVQSYSGALVQFALNKEETIAVKSLTKKLGITLNMLLLSSFNILLSYLSRQEDIIVGTPESGRSHPDLDLTVGMFVNTLAIKNKVEGKSSIEDFLKEVKQKIIKSYENRECQFEDLVKILKVNRDASHNPIFDVMFDFAIQSEGFLDESFSTDSEYMHVNRISKFDLSLSAIDYGNQILCSFEYCTDIFKSGTIEKMIEYYKKITKEICLNPKQKISEIEIISNEEKENFILKYNENKIAYPIDRTITELFQSIVNETPDKIALVYENQCVSYKGLDELSNQLSRYIQNYIGKNESFIGIYMDKGIELYISILATLKAGVGYLPIDTGLPEQRVKYMIRDSQINLVLTNTKPKENLFNDINLVDVNDFNWFKELTEPIETKNNIDSWAYIIYTSGSTGNPKGVLIKQAGVINTIYSQLDFYHITKDDRILQFSSLSFDASVEQIGIALLGGATLYAMRNEDMLEYDKFNDLIKKYVITHLDSVPGFLREIKIDSLPGLKRIVSGGDVCTHDLVDKFTDKDFYNVYGPTEASITSIRKKVHSDDSFLRTIPIGIATNNTQIYILNEENKIQGIGIPGELCISGTGLAEGYLNHPELTSEKFVNHPFIKDGLMYRTGDLSRYLLNGEIEFLGRIGQQVKIRGFRIELGEIENTLLKNENIKEVAVTVYEENDDKFLCAYIVYNNLNKEENLRGFLSSTLPDYMVPSCFVEMDKLPLTTGGKIDRKALPLPKFNMKEEYVAPSNEMEEIVAHIWSEVLHLEKEEISVTSNFFSIGGHSLKASHCVNLIRRKFGINFPLIEIFKNPTIKQITVLIENTKESGEGAENLVLLKKGNAQMGNIFFIHDGSGEIDGYIEFSKIADDDYNYWGIKADKFKEIEPRNISIEQIATEYIKGIKKIQPDGGYNIVGWSLGGIIALEIALQLEQENCKVEFLGVIDSQAPDYNNKEIYEFNIDSELKWIARYIQEAERMEMLSKNRSLKDLWNNIYQILNEHKDGKSLIKAEIIRNLGYQVKDYDKLSIEELIRYLNFTRSLIVSYSYYKPKNKVRFRINYFAAINSSIDINEWEELSEQELIIERVEGDHFSIFTSPNVICLYKLFIECFNRKEIKEYIKQYT